MSSRKCPWDFVLYCNYYNFGSDALGMFRNIFRSRVWKATDIITFCILNDISKVSFAHEQVNNKECADASSELLSCSFNSCMYFAATPPISIIVQEYFKITSCNLWLTNKNVTKKILILCVTKVHLGRVNYQNWSEKVIFGNIL